MEPTVIRFKTWEAGAHTYGYEIGKAHSLYYVKFFYPAAFFGHKEGNVLKLYKTLHMAEKKVSNFEKNNPPISLAALRAQIAKHKEEGRIGRRKG
jgi:hypothetical protein